MVHRRPLIGTPNVGSGSGRDRRAAFLVELNADTIPGQRFLIRHRASVVAALLIYCMLTFTLKAITRTSDERETGTLAVT